MTKVKLCAFADGTFAERKNGFNASAKESGFFDEIYLYDASTLPAWFIKKHGEFIANNQRGFGYWIWKPAVILETLDTCNEDDVLVYVDAGWTFNPKAQRRFSEYIDLTMDHPDRMLSFQNIFVEAHWTKMDLALHLGLSSENSLLKTQQLGGGMMMFQPTASNRSLMQMWLETMVYDCYHLVDDSPSNAPNHPDFQEHRHDQSVISLLRKMRGTELLHLETQSYANAFERAKIDLPVWATRLRK